MRFAKYRIQKVNRSVCKNIRFKLENKRLKSDLECMLERRGASYGADRQHDFEDEKQN